jgi:hypothetical protein
MIGEGDYDEGNFARKEMKKLSDQSKPIPIDSVPVNENIKPRRGVSMMAADGKLLRKADEKEGDVSPRRQTRSHYMESRAANSHFGPTHESLHAKEQTLQILWTRGP